MIEGIVYSLNGDEWAKTTDNWPANRRRARIKIDNEEDAFGNYSLSEATTIIEDAIRTKRTKDHWKFTIIPGKETTTEEKKRFEGLRKKKDMPIEEGPVESYISEE